ncbi:MAG: hypothetical protein Q7T79_03720 [bacterium]|nr:hypothetical protein [bacterium]
MSEFKINPLNIRTPLGIRPIDPIEKFPNSFDQILKKEITQNKNKYPLNSEVKRKEHIKNPLPGGKFDFKA